MKGNERKKERKRERKRERGKERKRERKRERNSERKRERKIYQSLLWDGILSPLLSSPLSPSQLFLPFWNFWIPSHGRDWDVVVFELMRGRFRVVNYFHRALVRAVCEDGGVVRTPVEAREDVLPRGEGANVLLVGDVPYWYLAFINKNMQSYITCNFFK
jgi:hypothetical protein